MGRYIVDLIVTAEVTAEVYSDSISSLRADLSKAYPKIEIACPDNRFDVLKIEGLEEFDENENMLIGPTMSPIAISSVNTEWQPGGDWPDKKKEGTIPF